MKVVLNAILLSFVTKQVTAFAPTVTTIPTSRNTVPSSSSSSSLLIHSSDDDNANVDIERINQNSRVGSRKDFFEQIQSSAMKASIFATVPYTTFLSSPSPAYADVTNKVASKSALRYIKRSIKEFEKLELYASMNDYAEIKQGLRGPAISEVRKNASVLIKGGEDGPEAENLVASYGAFIKDVEKLDGDASLGFRGRKGVELFPSYTQAVKDLKLFEEIAERATDIPVSSDTD